MADKIDGLITKLLSARESARPPAPSPGRPTAGCNAASLTGELLHPRRAEKPGSQVNLSSDEVTFLIEESTQIFVNQPALLELEAPIHIVGDIHGQYHYLLRLFEHCGFPPDSNYLFLGCAPRRVFASPARPHQTPSCPSLLETSSPEPPSSWPPALEQCRVQEAPRALVRSVPVHPPPPSSCLQPRPPRLATARAQGSPPTRSDYVDRGKNGLETICMLLAYKIKYPENFFLLRGNHECASINRIYGFYDECKRRYNIKMWKKFQDVFNVLPFAAVVDEKIFCIHAGLSPDLNSPDQIKRIMRPTDVPDAGLLCDLLWSDPEADIAGWAENDRGVSYTFGADVVSKFLVKHDFDLIVRAHQVVEDGYEFFADRQLVTIFSAPNYCGEFDNAGAVMAVDDSLMCSFRILKPAEKQKTSWTGRPLSPARKK